MRDVKGCCWWILNEHFYSLGIFSFIYFSWWCCVLTCWWRPAGGPETWTSLEFKVTRVSGFSLFCFPKGSLYRFHNRVHNSSSDSVVAGMDVRPQMSKVCREGYVLAGAGRVAVEVTGRALEPVGACLGVEETAWTSGNAAARLWEEGAKAAAALAIAILIFLFGEVVKSCLSATAFWHVSPRFPPRLRSCISFFFTRCWPCRQARLRLRLLGASLWHLSTLGYLLPRNTPLFGWASLECCINACKPGAKQCSLPHRPQEPRRGAAPRGGA